MATKNRLIAAEPYKEFLMQYAQDLTEMDAPMIAGAIERCLSKLDEQPTVDAVEVVHGEWTKHPKPVYFVNGLFYLYECSNCGKIVSTLCSEDRIDMDYCPKCGAKMDGDGNG